MTGDWQEGTESSDYRASQKEVVTKCGICALLEKLGIYEVTPALCALDYAMSDAGMASVFTRKYTLASGGPYCDCNYHKKQ